MQRRPSIPYHAIPFPRARAERVEAVFSPAQQRRRLMSLDPRDPPANVPADFEDEEEEFEDDEIDEEDEEGETI